MSAKTKVLNVFRDMGATKHQLFWAWIRLTIDPMYREFWMSNFDWLMEEDHAVS